MAAASNLLKLPGAILHRLADVHDEPAIEVGFGLVLFEVEAAGAAVDFPIDVFDVVAGDVFAVLGELDAEAVVGTFVHAGEVALDEEPGLEFEAPDGGEDGGVEVALGVVGLRHG